MNIRLSHDCCEKSYPKKRAAVVCTQGCNLKCNYCYCSHLIAKGAVSECDFDRILHQIRELGSRINAVVVTGGEPTEHEGLFNFISRIKELGLFVKIETNGTRPDELRALIQHHLIDSVSMDVKATPENYATVCGVPVDTEAIKSSIWIVKSSGIDHQFTTTLVPGFHTIREIRKIAGMVRGADRYIVRDFVSDRALRPELRGRAAFPHKPIESIRHILERKVKRFIIQSDEHALKMHIPGRRRRRRKAEIEMEIASA